MDRPEPTSRTVSSISGTGPHADVTVGDVEDGASDPDGSADDSETEKDRRVAVVDAILGLAAEGGAVTVEAVAERADVGVRTIYRLFGDLDHAVAEAQAERLVEVLALADRQVTPSPDLSLADRLGEMLDQRFELERLGRPLRLLRPEPNPDIGFDDDVREAFAPELARFDEERRRRVGLVMASALRPRAIRTLIDSEQDEGLARDTVRYTVIEAINDA